MNPEQALKNIDIAVAQLNSNRENHLILMECVKVLTEAIKGKDA